MLVARILGSLRLIVGFLSAAVRYVVVLCAVASFMLAGQAQAQNAEGYKGWAWGGVYYATPEEACRAQWQGAGMNNGYSRFIGGFPTESDYSYANCRWTNLGYLCPAETGGGLNSCWTVIPGSVSLQCNSGYTPTVEGLCRLDPAPERPCNCDEPGRVNPKVGHPIVLSTGAKVLSAQDFATADGQFSIGRQYRSFQVGRSISGVALPRSLTRGLAGGWNFDFNYEIQLAAFSGTPAAPNAIVGIMAPDGTGFGFRLQANGQWIPDPTFGMGNAPTHLKLEFVGTLPSDLSTLTAATSTWRLTDLEDNVWTLTTRIGPNGGSYNRGWPTSKVARDGYTWNYSYNADSSLASIADSFGRSAAFSWHKFYITSLASPPVGSMPYPQAISAIALPDGTSLKYSYDPPPATSAPSSSQIRRLVKVERLGATNTVLDSVQYLYEDQRFRTHVTGVIDNRSIRIRTYAYDAQGRGTLTSGPNGADAYTVEYGASGTARTRRVTNPLGKATNLTFTAYSVSQGDYRLTQQADEASAESPASTSAIGYGANTFTNSSTDAEGRITTTTRDARGRPVSVVEASATALARTTTYTWHPTLNLPVSIVRPGLTEDRTYNASGQLTAETLTDTTTHTVPYPTNGQTRTVTYSWTAQGRLASMNGPLAASGPNDDVTSFTYDTQGNLLTATNALGQVTSYSGYDGRGNPGAVTDANGVVTAYGYDGIGRVQTVTVQHPGNPALNAVTSITYDAAGQVTALTLPSTDTLLMDYDAAGQLVSMRAASGERWDYVYDKMGNVTAETTKRTDGSTSLQIARAFDELGRLVRITTGPQRTSRWSYDKVGNAVLETTPNGHATSTAFDALDRVVNTVAPDGGATALAWNPQDNVTGHTDPIAVTTQFTHNGFGEVIREVSPDRGTNTYLYDGAGQLIQATDGRDQVIAYSYDWLGRVTSKTPQGRPSSEVVSYVWDAGGLAGSYAVGRLAKIVDGSGETLFAYDHRGSVVAQRQTIGATAAADLAYQYDLAGRITQIAYPSGRQVRYNRDTKGRVASIETRANAAAGWTVLASAITYEPFGSPKAMTLGNGLSVQNSWDAGGLLTARRLYRTATALDLSNLIYQHYPDGNIAAIEDAVTPANSVMYGYDPAGRLRLTVAGSGIGSGAESYGYTAGTNKLAAITTAAGTRTVTYDARGNTAGEVRPGGVSVTTAYDGYARLTGYARTGGEALTFAYNGRDDRTGMTSTSLGTRAFVYGADGRVLGEYGNSAADVKAEFIWASPEVGDGSMFGSSDMTGGYAPLAVATPDLLGAVQLRWVHGNHLGVPLVTSDAGGNPIAPGNYLLPGFPGQSRVLPDLYYNRYRDYDPTTGRYVQADPIGLDGGSNVYGYAGGNPVNAVDPMGLQIAVPVPVCFAGPWGALACAAIPAASCLLIPACRDAFVPPDRPGQPPRYPPLNPPRQPSDDDPRECCHDKCTAETVGRGYLDAPLRYRKCMRECLKDFGIDDY